MTGSFDERVAALEGRIGHTFTNRTLLREALTHRSYRHEHPQESLDNERLEYLGDALIQSLVSETLFKHFSVAREGELTKRRADLVRESSLSECAIELQLGDYIQLGRGEETSGGRDKRRLLASAFEALIAALYLDGGYTKSKDLVTRLLSPRLTDFNPGEDDYKSRLQEYLQGIGQGAPDYRLVASLGPEHDRTYQVEVLSQGLVLGSGEGRSKVEAQQQAAGMALRAIPLDAPGNRASEIPPRSPDSKKTI